MSKQTNDLQYSLDKIAEDGGQYDYKKINRLIATSLTLAIELAKKDSPTQLELEFIDAAREVGAEAVVASLPLIEKILKSK